MMRRNRTQKSCRFASLRRYCTDIRKDTRWQTHCTFKDGKIALKYPGECLRYDLARREYFADCFHITMRIEYCDRHLIHLWTGGKLFPRDSRLDVLRLLSKSMSAYERGSTAHVEQVRSFMPDEAEQFLQDAHGILNVACERYLLKRYPSMATRFDRLEGKVVALFGENADTKSWVRLLESQMYDRYCRKEDHELSLATAEMRRIMAILDII